MGSSLTGRRLDPLVKTEVPNRGTLRCSSGYTVVKVIRHENKKEVKKMESSGANKCGRRRIFGVLEAHEQCGAVVSPGNTRPDVRKIRVAVLECKKGSV